MLSAPQYTAGKARWTNTQQLKAVGYTGEPGHTHRVRLRGWRGRMWATRVKGTRILPKGERGSLTGLVVEEMSQVSHSVRSLTAGQDTAVLIPHSWVRLRAVKCAHGQRFAVTKSVVWAPSAQPYIPCAQPSMRAASSWTRAKVRSSAKSEPAEAANASQRHYAENTHETLCAP